MSRCPLDTCRRGIRISGCHCACALRVPSTWKWVFFLLSAYFKTFLPSFLVLYQHNLILKVFHIHVASSSLKDISHALAGPISSRSTPSIKRCVLWSITEHTKQNIDLVVQPTNIKKERQNGRENWKHATWRKKKKHLRISPTHSEYAAYNASGYLDTCKRRKRFDPPRVNAPKISGSLRSGYPDIRISGYV